MEVTTNTIGSIRQRTQRMVDRFQEKFVFSPVFTFPWHGTPDGGVVGGRITCLSPQSQRYPYSELLAADVRADSMEIMGFEGFEGKTVQTLPTDKSRGIYAIVATQPGIIADALCANHGNEGVIILRSLLSVTAEQWLDWELNSILFGDEEIRTLAGMRTRLASVQSITTGGRRKLIDDIVKELTISLDVAERKYRQEIRETHAEMDQARGGNTTAKATYDRRDLRLLEWLQLTPRGDALDRLADSYNLVPGMLQGLQQPAAAAPQPSVDPLMVGEMVKEGIKEGMTAVAGVFAEILERQQARPEEPSTKGNKKAS